MICGDVTIVLHCSIWSNQKCICSELTHSVKIEGLRFCPYKLRSSTSRSGAKWQLGFPIEGKGLVKFASICIKVEHSLSVNRHSL